MSPVPPNNWQPPAQPGATPPPQGDAAQQPDRIVLKHYWDLVLQFKVHLLLIFILGFSASYVIYKMVPSRYRATVKLIIKDSMNQSSISSDYLGGIEVQDFSFQDLNEIAMSQDVLMRTLERTRNEFSKLKNHTSYIVPEKERLLEEQMSADRVAEWVSLNKNKDSTNVFKLTAIVDEGKHIAPLLVNTMADVLIEKLDELSREGLKNQLRYLDELRLEKMKELKALDEKIAFMKKLFDRQRDNGLGYDLEKIRKRLEQLELQERQLTYELSQKREQILEIREKFSITGVPLNKVRWIDLSDPKMKELQTLKAKREELLTRYTPANPAIAKINNQIQALEAVTGLSENGSDTHPVMVDRFHAPQVSSLINMSNEVETSEKYLKSLKDEINGIKTYLADPPDSVRELQGLERQKLEMTKMVGDINTSYEKIKILLESDDTKIGVLERADMHQKPTRQGLAYFMVLGGIVSLTVGVIAVVILSHWDDTMKNNDDFQRNFHMAPIGIIPKWSRRHRNIDPESPDSRIAELYAVLRNNILHCEGEPEKCLLVGSSIQSEGKSLTSSNLSLSFALDGMRVLLLSGDIRNRNTHSGFQLLDPRQPGLTEYLQGEVEIANVIGQTNVQGLFYVPAGEKVSNPGRVLKSPRLKELIEEAKNLFDVIIVDSPAILPVADYAVFSGMVNSVLLVVESRNTSAATLGHTLGRLAHLKVPLAGFVLNKAKMRDLRSDYSYGMYYGRYYSTGS